MSLSDCRRAFLRLGGPMAGLHGALLIVAVILFVLSAIPPVPYQSSLRGIGLAFLAGSFLVP